MTENFDSSNYYQNVFTKKQKNIHTSNFPNAEKKKKTIWNIFKWLLIIQLGAD